MTRQQHTPEIVPTRAAFQALAATDLEHPLAVPIVCTFTADEVDPLDVYAVLGEGSRYAALLESTSDGVGNATTSIVATSVSGVLTGDDALDALQAACCERVADIGVAVPAFIGGGIGMLAHEYCSRIEPTVPRAAATNPAQLYDATFLLVDEFIAFEPTGTRALHTVRLAAGRSSTPQELDASYDAAVASLRAMADAVATIPHAARLAEDGPAPAVEVTPSVPKQQFLDMVHTAREHVRSGECVQIVVSQRFDRPFSGTAIDAYAALRATSPAPYTFLLQLDDVELIGASPEQLVGVDGRAGGQVVTHPIAGTRRRGATPAHDDALAAELAADPKERAEHMMLVDLGRNDLARVSVPGTVSVPNLAQVERFSHVMHLVSRVEGVLRSELAPADVLRSCFPAGTLTGAPKVRAMQHIAQLEPSERGAYGGVVGYVGHGGMLDMAITIRTIVLSQGVASVQAGAGVVAASDPEREYEETREKASAALAALAHADSHRRAPSRMEVMA